MEILKSYKNVEGFSTGKNSHHYVMISVNKNGEIQQHPYVSVGGKYYEKIQNEIILGVLKVDNGVIVNEIEQTPHFHTDYSKYVFPKKLPEKQKIWRYLEYYKFEDLISSSTLFFSRLDQFIDNLEGVSPESCKAAILADMEFDREKKKKNINLFESRMKDNRKNGFVCCWHINDKINYDMWNLYGNNSCDSIVVETNKLRLYDATKKSLIPILFEPIRYYEEPFFNQETYWFPTLFKKQDYEYENEYRSGVFISGLENRKFIRIKTDLELLISKIYIHPEASVIHENKVRNLLDKYQRNIPVIKCKI